MWRRTRKRLCFGNYMHFNSASEIANFLWIAKCVHRGHTICKIHQLCRCSLYTGDTSVHILQTRRRLQPTKSIQIILGLVTGVLRRVKGSNICNNCSLEETCHKYGGPNPGPRGATILAVDICQTTCCDSQQDLSALVYFFLTGLSESSTFLPEKNTFTNRFVTDHGLCHRIVFWLLRRVNFFFNAFKKVINDFSTSSSMLNKSVTLPWPA